MVIEYANSISQAISGPKLCPCYALYLSLGPNSIMCSLSMKVSNNEDLDQEGSG